MTISNLYNCQVYLEHVKAGCVDEAPLAPDWLLHGHFHQPVDAVWVPAHLRENRLNVICFDQIPTELVAKQEPQSF